MAPVTRDKKEQRIASLMEMGVSRASAKAALRAKSWQTDEAALIVFEDRYAEAADIPTSDEEDSGSRVAAISSSNSNAIATDKGKGRAKEVTKLPTPDEDELDDEVPGEDEGGFADQDEDNYFEEDEGGADFADSDAASVDYGDGDAYGFLDISKDRQVEIKEVEEPVKKVKVSKSRRGEFSSSVAALTATQDDYVSAEIFGLQRWLSGCPEGNEQQQLFPLYTGLTSSGYAPPHCPYNCGAIIEHQESDFFAVPDSFDTYIDRLCSVCQIACIKCGKGICLACNEPCELRQSNADTKDRNQAPEVLLHCPNLQAVIIGVGLHLAGRLWEETANTTDSSSVNTKKRKAVGGSGASSDYDEYSHYAGPGSGRKTFSSGTGYGGGGKDDHSGMKAVADAQKTKDKQLATLLSHVRVYLPNRNRPGAFMNSDHMPAGQTLAHLRRRFNPIASLMLSAESLSDMSDRKELYTEFMAWLEVMSGHENLAGLMGQPIMRVSSITYPETKSSSGAGGREKVIIFEASPGPRELLERILSQVQVAKKVASAAKAREEAIRKEREDALSQAEKDKGKAAAATGDAALEQEVLGGPSYEETNRMMDFCETIEKAVFSIDKALKQSKRGEAVLKRMQSTSPITSKGPSVQGGSSNAASSRTASSLTNLTNDELKAKYEEWAKQINYQFYDWSVEDEGKITGYKHSYSKEALNTVSHPARNTALMKEHASLSSSLPAGWNSSVFLLVDEGRPDIMKALIIGPDDTPYENGCFIFDILMGSSYNTSPPNVKSMTTMNWQYRLNPNLYANGKVCLSLLGTWAGPGWVPGKSTLLQVLVSIQSMILWAEPITNEPGFEKDIKSARSRAYNANVRRMVVYIAMLDLLKNPPEGFREIIETHFRLKARAVCDQLDTWLKEDDGNGLFKDSMSAIHGTRVAGSSSLLSGMGMPASMPTSIASAIAATSAAGTAATAQGVAPVPSITAAATADAGGTAVISATASSGASTPAVSSGTPTSITAAQSAFVRNINELKELLRKLELGTV